MGNIIGIINLSSRFHRLEGLAEYRPIAATSFLGRYRLIDFQMSNFTNSGIEKIHIHTDRKPKSIADHVGTGRHYNINSKRGKIEIFYPEDCFQSEVYNHDINSLKQSLRELKQAREDYVIIAPGHSLFRVDYQNVLAKHIASGKSISVLYKKVTNGMTSFVGCDRCDINDRGLLEGIHMNRGDIDDINISLETYVCSRKDLINFLEAPEMFSSVFWFRDIISHLASTMEINTIEYTGFYRNINSLENYYNTSLELLDPRKQAELFSKDWTIYTKTHNSRPTLYINGSDVKKSCVANGCTIKGTVVNSVLGRNVVIEEGAVVENSIIFSNSYVGKDVHLKNVILDRYVQVKELKEIARDKITYIKRDDVI